MALKAANIHISKLTAAEVLHSLAAGTMRGLSQVRTRLEKVRRELSRFAASSFPMACCIDVLLGCLINLIGGDCS